MSKEIWVEDERVAKKFGLNLKIPGSGKDVVIASFQDLRQVEELERKGVGRIFVSCSNWKVIPLENLIAIRKKAKLIALVSGSDEAKLALQTLEKGVDGVLLEKPREKDVKEVLAFLEKGGSTEIMPAKVSSVRKIGLGARSCIDTAELMTKDEGMLVGSAASALVLVQAEVSENPHVASRPFRVNCGALSMYALMADGKTKYLSEIKAGDEILIASKKGKTRKALVVRNKIEWRPLLLIEAKAKGREVKALVQDAETIRVITPKASKSVAELKKGDEILAHVEEETARHFGMKVNEKIIEK